MALSGHAARSIQCPLLGVKRTSLARSQMSAFDPKRTSSLFTLPAYEDVASLPTLFLSRSSSRRVGGDQSRLISNGSQEYPSSTRPSSRKSPSIGMPSR